MIFKNWLKWQFSQKNPRSTKRTHLKGVDPNPPVLNENGPWIPLQEQNPFIFHKTIYDEQNYLSYRYQGQRQRVLV